MCYANGSWLGDRWNWQVKGNGGSTSAAGLSRPRSPPTMPSFHRLYRATWDSSQSTCTSPYLQKKRTRIRTSLRIPATDIRTGLIIGYESAPPIGGRAFCYLLCELNQYPKR